MINQAVVRDEPDGRGRRAQIVDAALHVMAERGFRGASIKRIAEHAGLKSPALIYWYFKDKQALFEAMLEEMAPFLGVVANTEWGAINAAQKLNDPGLPYGTYDVCISLWLQAYGVYGYVTQANQANTTAAGTSDPLTLNNYQTSQPCT